MPAYFDSGMMVREPAWHGLGNVVGEYPGDWDEARRLAGLDWEPETAPVYGFAGTREDGSMTYDPADAVDGSYQPIENRVRILRSDTGATLGTATGWYAKITNAELGEILEGILQQPNVKYETVVSMKGGREVAAVVRLDEPITIAGDNSPTYPLLAVTTRHDATGACRAQATTIRIVCANTFAMAEAEADRSGAVFSFEHMGDTWHNRLEEAALVIRGLRQDFTGYTEFATHLAGVKVTKRQTERFITEFLPKPIEAGVMSDRVLANIDKAREAVRAILAGPTCETIHGTAYGLLQAGTEYLDWTRGYENKETLFGRQLLRPEKRKAAAVKLIESITG